MKSTVSFQMAFFFTGMHPLKTPIRCPATMLGIVNIAKDVLRGMVARNFIHDGVDNRAHLVPLVDLRWHHNDNTEDDMEGVGGGEIEHNTS